MKIIRAQHYGMCFGVRDAITLAKQHSAQESLTILGDLVHNQQVMNDLQRDGVTVEKEIDSVQTSKVMITAHGASDQRIEDVKAHGHEVIEATCPLVKHAHRSIQKLASNGYFPVIIGKKDHVEVKGLVEDLESSIVIESAAEIPQIPWNAKIGVASQTTQPINKVREIVQKIELYFHQSEVKFVDTVCRPTKDRQKAAEELAVQCDTVLCVGGEDSNNTKMLKIKSEQLGAKAFHIQGPDDITLDMFENTQVLGITAGTSTPLEIVDAVEERLDNLLKSFSNSAPHLSTELATH